MIFWPLISLFNMVCTLVLAGLSADPWAIGCVGALGWFTSFCAWMALRNEVDR